MIAEKVCDETGSTAVNLQPDTAGVGSSTSKVPTATAESSIDQAKTVQGTPSLSDIRQLEEVEDQTAGKDPSTLSCVKKNIANENRLTAEASKALLSESSRDKPGTFRVNDVAILCLAVMHA